jgi:hypothetical protein
MGTIRDGLRDLAEENQPLTIRQLFYRAVATGLIDKTQAAYNQLVVRLMGQMREDGTIPFAWIIDNTRWMRKPTTYHGLRSMLVRTHQTYRRAIWDEQDATVEIWCESDSVAGILWDVTNEYDVPLMPCSGQPSKSFLHSAAENMVNIGGPWFIYYFGDYDKTGMDISARIERDLTRYTERQLDDDVFINFTFERVAINEAQIRKFNLPTRPPKDKRGGFTKTVELEAMTTAQLQHLCRQSITRHIDWRRLEALREVEDAERNTLATIIKNLELEAA